jgi:hypothetical protein
LVHGDDSNENAIQTVRTVTFQSHGQGQATEEVSQGFGLGDLDSWKKCWKTDGKYQKK